MAYDSEGQRVALQVNGGIPTYSLGVLEVVTGSTLTTYLSAAAQLRYLDRYDFTDSHHCTVRFRGNRLITLGLRW